MECAFKGADTTKLTVTRGGSALPIPKADVAAIVQQKPRSSKRAWIGAAVGGGATAGLAVAAMLEADYREAFVIGLGVVWGLIGAGAGALIGYFSTDQPPDEVLYQAP